ncbi:MAG: SDR family oxidoreductase [Bermanella sp.]
MKTNQINAVITGATGGIGRSFAQHLVQSGATIIMVGRNTIALKELQNELLTQLVVKPNQVHIFPCDLLKSEDRQNLVEHIENFKIPVNTLINNAGDNEFALIEDLSEERIEKIMRLNTLTPMLLSRALISHLSKQEQSQIVNIGSTFGSIGYPGYSAYCASKYALRGFSEALRRELSDGPIAVKYLSPRATQTSLNSASVNAMNKELKVAMDSTHVVAGQLIKLLESKRHELFIGWPEKFFSKLNQLAPALVGKSIVKQLPTIRRYAQLN